MYAGKSDSVGRLQPGRNRMPHRTLGHGTSHPASPQLHTGLNPAICGIAPVLQGRTPHLMNLSVHRSYPRRVVVCVYKVGLLAWNTGAEGFVFPGISRVTS